jgi:glycosyltransferase involved in cell wall biosynthesis
MKVNIFGHCFGASGWAQHTRQFSAALAQLDDVVVVPWDAPPPGVGALAPLADADIGIGIGPIERMADVVGRWRVGFVVWETTIVPERKLRVLGTLDEVWTPSEWGRVVLLQNGLSEDRVHVVPEGVDPLVFRSLGPVPDDARRPFRFLCVAKWEVRKGIADLALAFAREFGPAEPAELILHCFNPYLHSFDIRLALEGLDLPAHARIRASNPLPLPGLLALYNRCDVLVQPTKAEGWGLPIIEALACGIPVIATNYSAHTAFLNDDNGYLLDVTRMIPVDDPFFYGVGEPLGVWAQPDLDHLRRLMRRAFENTAERRDKGRQARRDVVQRWTWQDAARIAHRRLQVR